MGRGKRKYDAPLQPNGTAMYVPRGGGSVVPDYIDITSLGSSTNVYTTTANRLTWSFDPPGETGVKAIGGTDMSYDISGTFQEIHFDVEGLRSLKDNPVEAVVREVLGLYPDDELLGISYRTASGEVKVRSWFEDE